MRDLTDTTLESMNGLLTMAAAQYGYPLHIAFRAADGTELLVYVLPAKGGTPEFKKKVSGDGGPLFKPEEYPLSIIIRGWDAAASAWKEKGTGATVSRRGA